VRAASSAPLGAGYSETPLWHAGVVGPETGAPAPLPTRADVLVVGAGYCGLAAAAGLARHGRRVVVLEAGTTGAGASTRNGGMVIPELKFGPRTLVRRHGPLGAALVQCALDAYDLVERTVTEHEIDCDYEQTGALLLAHHPSQVRGLRDAEAEWRELGVAATFLSRAELGREIGTDEYDGGLVVEKTAAVQPAKFHAALRAEAVSAGAEIHERTRATGCRRAGDGFRVVTTKGNVEVADVLSAANAYADGFLPQLRRRVLPVGSFIVATEPLPAEVARAVLPGRRMCFDTKHLLYYWRLSPDRRMVFGGRTSLAYHSVADARDALYRAMCRVHPQLTGVAIDYAWGGDVAITRDRLPHCGRLDGVAFATGCNGTGIALATWFGTHLAEWIAGDEAAPPFAQLSFPFIPFYDLRSVWMPPAGAALRVLDRWGR